MAACPFCSEEIDAGARKCVHCGEVLDRAPPPPPPKSYLGLAVGLLVLVFVVICVAPAVIIPSLVQPNSRSNESAAIGALKTISTAQTLFREGDKDGDQVLDFGTLQELSDATLIDMILGSGIKQGYVFDAAPASATPELLWMAVANPAAPGLTGDRYFVVNQDGLIHDSTTAPFVITPDGALPSHAIPIGK